jgi:hypothetical protein
VAGTVTAQTMIDELRPVVRTDPSQAEGQGLTQIF